MQYECHTNEWRFVTGHTEAEPVQEKAVESTCLKEGSHEDVVYCEVCGEELSREEVTDELADHTWGKEVVTYCGICFEEISRGNVEEIPALEKVDTSNYSEEDAKAVEDAMKAVNEAAANGDKEALQAAKKAVEDAVVTAEANAKKAAEEKAAADKKAAEEAAAKAAADKKAAAVKAPAKVKIAKNSKIKAKKKKLVVKWTAQADCDGYEIQIATNKKFTKGLKVIIVNKATAKSKTIKKLEAKKKYYIRIRAFKNVDGGMVFGKRSAKRNKKTK